MYMYNFKLVFMYNYLNGLFLIKVIILYIPDASKIQVVDSLVS